MRNHCTSVQTAVHCTKVLLPRLLWRHLGKSNRRESNRFQAENSTTESQCPELWDKVGGVVMNVIKKELRWRESIKPLDTPGVLKVVEKCDFCTFSHINSFLGKRMFSCAVLLPAQRRGVGFQTTTPDLSWAVLWSEQDSGSMTLTPGCRSQQERG